MKFLGNKTTPHDANARRQNSIQRGDPPLGLIAPLRQIYMRALRESMNARVGATGAVHAQRLRTNLFERVFEPVLNRVAIGLALPSGETRTIVGNDQLEPRRHLVGWRNIALHLAIARALHSIEVALQNHLSCDLVHEGAGISRLLSALA